jgi:murein L,D-transpeptidase YcbB/YkuD
MKRVGVISRAFLLFALLGATAFSYAQVEQQSEKQGGPGKKSEPQKQPRKQQERAKQQRVPKPLAYGTDADLENTSSEPALPEYRRLQTALLKYIQLAQEDDGEKLPMPPSAVLPGTPYEGIPRLSRLLRRLGDLPETAVIPANSQIYDGPLVEAVKRFQERHGLHSDGGLDQDTLVQLNVPLSERVEQIRLALKRYRALRSNFPQPSIIINIPEFRLYALDNEGKVGLTMTVDVGQDFKDTRTPVLQANLQYLIFRPYWDVPFAILKDEIVPNLQDDPNYLSEFGFEVVTPDGKVVTDGRVTKGILEQIRSGRLRVRQSPGRTNSLGLVKFVFPNRYNVYLHDIPPWGDYFANPDREISHGCVHVKEPAQLAAWLLRDKPEWTLEAVQHAMKDGPDNLRINLTKPLPVLIVYMTAVVREHGEVYFYRDIYGYDAKSQWALAKGHPYP